MIVPPNASCPAHESMGAIAVCQRCGTFMCETCSEYGIEVRCAACRPKRGRAEIEERRANACRRAENVRCLCCAYEGPRFDLYAPVGLRRSALIALGFGLGILPGLFVMRGLLAPTCPCVSCGSTTDLVPLLPPAVPTEASFSVWAQAQPVSNNVRERNQLRVAGCTAMLVLLAVAVMTLSST